MTNPEFLEEFDVLYNSICSNEAPGLDPYEKSIFLTEAQEELIKECYSSRAASFEINEAIRRSLSSIVKFETLHPEDSKPLIGGIAFNLPLDTWIITYERVKFKSDNSCINNKEVQVVPTTQDEFNRIKKNPFRGPTNNRVLRLDVGDLQVSLVSTEEIDEYIIGYISKPSPIILENLEDGLKIDGKDKYSECTLNSYTHRFILERAVNKAALVYKR